MLLFQEMQDEDRLKITIKQEKVDKLKEQLSTPADEVLASFLIANTLLQLSAFCFEEDQEASRDASSHDSAKTATGDVTG